MISFEIQNIIIAGFGWAKPVQFNPENLRNYRRDKALIAAAGPLSNMVLGTILALIIRGWIILLNNNHINPILFNEHLFYVLYYAATINFGLFIFNLLPIPPLDGSHIVFSGLNLDLKVEDIIRKVGMPLLLAILIIQNRAEITIIPIGKIIFSIMNLFLNFGMNEV